MDLDKISTPNKNVNSIYRNVWLISFIIIDFFIILMGTKTVLRTIRIIYL